MLFKKVAPTLINGKTKYLISIVGGVFVLMNIFYFFNLIPPIPLALKESGVYQNVTKQSQGYTLTDFSHRFSFRNFKKEYNVAPGSPVYFYSSVFAPIKFEQGILHEWQKRNTKGEWITVSSVAFPIFGGNDLGYRGYTISQQITKGEWRVLVKTDGGQVLGGETFVVR